MKKEIKTEITINSTQAEVWEKLTNFEEYPKWNPFIKELKGKIRLGNKIKVKIQPPESSPMNFEPQIMDYQENKLLQWKGKLLFKGLFDGTHKFELIDNKNGTVTFLQNELFEGVLARFLNLDKTKEGFNLMNHALKELCEN